VQHWLPCAGTLLRWFWIPSTDIQSKYTFGFVMLLFSISDTGVKGTAPVVTVPAN